MLMEFFGISVLVYTAIRSFVCWIKKDEGIRLKLAHGIALALEFKMGGEVLHTVVVRQWEELGVLGALGDCWRFSFIGRLRMRRGI